MKLVFVILLFFPFCANAFNYNCAEIQKNYSASFVTQFPQQQCRISIKDYRVARRYLRFFNFNKDGRFDIFDSDSTIDNNSEGTGIRVIYNLPRQPQVTAQLVVDNFSSRFQVVLPNGEWIEFDGDTHTISNSSMPLAEQTENFGGIHFTKPSRGLLIDTKFHLGRESYAHPSLPGISDVINTDGKICAVPNKLLFIKKGDNYPLKADPDLKNIFSEYCGVNFIQF